MQSLVFVCASPGSDPEVLIMAESIRRFAGSLSECPVWMVIPESIQKIPEKIENQLRSLDVQIVPFQAGPAVNEFPFARWVHAAGAAESLAKGKTELLAWIDINTIIIRKPRQFLLDKGKNLGYRPVHHTLIGSIYETPIDSFWNLIYQKCGVTEDRIFPMKTHVDCNILRPYFNAGFLIVRPERGLLQSWWETFKELYRDPDFKEFYQKDDLYTIFIHQAVLTGVILSRMERKELQELPFSYNYPLHLYEESPPEYQPENINDLVTARFYLDKLLKPGSLDRIPIHDPLKSWLAGKLEVIINL
ncbi:MAG: hypothetical protein WBA22_19875 [Candidatus Methanofastidiosia archaeon]